MFSKSLFGLSKLATKSSLFGLQPLRGVSTMKHVSLGGFGDPSVLSFGESPIPKPKEDQVLIKVTNSALNRADTIQRKGRYPPPKGASEIIGLEAAGYLCKPDGTFDTSKKVMALLEGGGHAQYCVVHKDQVIQVPEGISLQEAGGIPEVWITAFLLLELAQIKPKDKVLIYAGASGVGTAAIQLVNLFGGIPIVTCSTDDKIDFTKKVGAEVALNYKKSENLTKDILSVTGPKGVDIILDCVGPAYTSINTEVAGIDARWILYGLLTGAKAKEFNMASLVTKRISLISTTLRTRSSQYKGDLIKRFNERVIPHFKEGKCKVYIDSVVDVDWKDPKPLQDAHTRIEDNKNFGKIILNFKD